MSYPRQLPPGQNYNSHGQQQSPPMPQPYGQHQPLYNPPQYHQSPNSYQQPMYPHRPQSNMNVMSSQFNQSFMSLDQSMQFQYDQPFQQRFPSQSIAPPVQTSPAASLDSRSYSQSSHLGMNSGINAGMNMGPNMNMYASQHHQPLPPLQLSQSPLHQQPQQHHQPQQHQQQNHQSQHHQYQQQSHHQSPIHQQNVPHHRTQSYLTQSPMAVPHQISPQFPATTPQMQSQTTPVIPQTQALTVSSQSIQQSPQTQQTSTLNPMDSQFVNPTDTMNLSSLLEKDPFVVPATKNPHTRPRSQPNDHESNEQSKGQPPPVANRAPKQQKARKRFVAPNSSGIQPPPMPTLPNMNQPKTPVMTNVPTPPQGHGQYTSQTIRTKPPAASASHQQNPPRTPSVTSPALSVKSSISKRSPSVSIRSRIADPLSLYGCVAEECLAAAHASIPSIVMATTDAPIRDFQKLIATGLSCLEATLQSGRLSPRQEARMRLRYAQVLYDNTDNLMEAEMTLSKGLTLCDRHRFLDLKYVMRYLLLKILFYRSPKAAMVAADKDISDANAMRHHQWVYTFRLLKASFHMQLGNPADVVAIDNLRQLGTLAQNKGDYTLCAFSHLLEALALLKTTKQENLDRIQECLAVAIKNQISQQQQLLQIDILILMVDLACSMHQKQTEVVTSKLKALQDRMDEMQNSGEWSATASVFFIPIKKQGSTSHISEDSASIISPGEDVDYLVFSFVTRVELMVLIMTFSGIAVSFETASTPPKSLEFWKEAMETLDRWESEGVVKTQPEPTLQEALRRANWRSQIRCYLLVVSGLFAATHSRWTPVKETVKKLESLLPPEGDSIVDLMGLYLRGIYHQGTGELDEALRIFNDPRYCLDTTGGTRSPKLDVCILVALNRVWILQHPDYFPSSDIGDLLDSLGSICRNHPDVEIQTVYNLVIATIVTDPPQSLSQIKTSMHASIGGSKMTLNKHCLAIALNVMRCKLFEHVMGEQALKSAKAAAAQAKRGGNLLWISVAEGMLATSHEVMNHGEEAAAAREQGAQHAARALGQ